ncbi:MAG: hypothetical protein JST11_27070 [Acidobacteria bacterium]|nr:hypothetical protein [Acidobacteriota bacterium]
MRAFGTALMAVLVVAALFWGNCYSCPQMLLAKAQHACCHRTKAPKDECATQGLRTFVKAEKAAPVSTLPVTVATIAPPAEHAPVSFTAAPLPVDSAPTLAVPLRI